MSKIVHPIAGMLAIATIATFWISTIVSEIAGSHAAIVAVKTAIPWGFLILVPAIAMTGASGFALAQGRTGGLVGKKRKRMPFIAANGVLVLIPAALYLSFKAQAGELDGMFYAVQLLELIAGAVNLTLLVRNALDGRRMTARRHAHSS